METLNTNPLQPQNNPSSSSFVVKWVMILALTQIVLSLIIYLTGTMMNPFVKWLSFPITFVVALFATQNFRDKEAGGFISFNKGFGITFQIVIFAAIITTIYTYIFFKFIDHGMIDQIAQQARQKMADKDMSEEQIDKAMGFARVFMSPGAISLAALLMSAFIGAIISLIVAAICKKENYTLLPPQ